MIDQNLLLSALVSSALTASLVVAGPAAAREVGARLGITAIASTTTIPLQVRLSSSSGAPVNGLKTVTFKLYTVPSGGAALWTETWTAGNAVQVTDGVASVLLGSQTALPQSIVANNSTLYLGITVDVEAEMQPRVQLGSAPIAMTVPDGSLGNVKLADGAVTQQKAPTLIRSLSLTNQKIATGIVQGNASAVKGAILHVSFGGSFVAPPNVIVSSCTDATNFAWASVVWTTQTVTADGFDVWFELPAVGTGTYRGCWFAIGQ